MNELPLGGVLSQYGMPTSGPNLHKGQIGKRLPTACDIDISPRFRRILLDPVYADFIGSLSDTDLSSDQCYLRDMISVISTGIVPQNFAKRSPGKIGYARWLTTANRVLRVYLTFEEPPDRLCSAVLYIVHVYSRMWFEIKFRSLIEYGARHIYNLIKYTHSLDNPETTYTVEPFIKRNGYFLHSENLLLAMLADENSAIRNLAISRIQRAREIGEINLRQFRVPWIDFTATVYHELICYADDWLEPRLTMEYSIEYLQSNNINFGQYPNHNQGVERMIRLTSETAKMFANPDHRDSRIFATTVQRKIMPLFNSKKDFRI